MRYRNLSLIYASTKEGGIGSNNQLPWRHISKELWYFRKYTSGAIIVMGRETWEGLNYRTFPERKLIVLSRKPSRLPKEVLANTIRITTDLVKAADWATSEKDNRVAIITNIDYLLQFVSKYHSYRFVVAGGKKIYERLQDHVTSVSHSIIPDEYLLPDRPIDTVYKHELKTSDFLFKRTRYYLDASNKPIFSADIYTVGRPTRLHND